MILVNCFISKIYNVMVKLNILKIMLCCFFINKDFLFGKRKEKIKEVKL